MKPELTSMTLDKKSRDMVHAIDKNGGRATTTEIRRETGLDNPSVRYRYDKLRNRGLIETTKDEDATPDGVAPLTVAKLTDTGREEIEKGLTFEQEMQTATVEPTDNAERIEELEQKISDQQDQIRQLQETINWIGPRVEELIEQQNSQK